MEWEELLLDVRGAQETCKRLMLKNTNGSTEDICLEG